MMTPLLILLLTSLVSIFQKSGASSVGTRFQAQHARQSSSGSAHDTLCNSMMCIECDVEGDVARYTLRSTGAQKLGWMAIGFGNLMGDSAMVIMWPSRDEDGSYASVTLSQRKAPFEVMPEPDPNPPFVATLELGGTSVTGEHPQIAFTRPAPPDGLQNIIWAFSRTSPESADENVDLSVHHKYGIGALNLTRTTAAADVDASPSLPTPSAAAPDVDVDPEQPLTAVGDGEGQESSDVKTSETEAAVAAATSGGGGFTTLVHATLCIVGFLFVIPAGALVVRYAKVTGSSAAFDLHQTLQFRVAGASIAGGMLAYLFMENDGSGTEHKWWGTGLLLLYGLQCVVGFQAQRTPARDRTRAHPILLSGLGASIVLLAFYDAWLGFVAAGDSPLLWGVLLIAVPSFYIVGVVVIRHHFGPVQVVPHGEYVVLDTRAPNDEAEVGEVRQAASTGL
ncbi:hypothetical protein BJV78DRAFT_609685 [Lactifluus subvellereus]|nr:hypothetical protein BJV78DRAFT_609685 [Lactifluus subvellereus]